jgi:hypothetical protein
MPPTLQDLHLPTDKSETHQSYVHNAIHHLMLINDELTPSNFCQATWDSVFVNLGECSHWCYRSPHHAGPCICPCGASKGVLPVTQGDRLDNP